MKILLSVIVPIYNVEKYLPRCLDSLASQSISGVEFLLIDDGSTDRSGKIADSYSDKRYRTYHTENHGLSAARNFGIEKARGDWLLFVDGDDYVEPDICEKTIKAIQDYKADLVIFQAYAEKKIRQRIFKTCDGTTPYGIVEPKTAIVFGESVVWNKLYKRELFVDLFFPEGRTHEDLAVTHKAIISSKRIVIIPDILYHYVYRKDSISNTHSANSRKDGFILAMQRANDLRNEEYEESTYNDLVWTRALAFLATTYPSSDAVFHQAEEVVNCIPGIPNSLPWKHKVMLGVWKINPSLFHFISYILGQKDVLSRSK